MDKKGGSGIKFLTKQEREQLALQKLEEKRRQQEEERKKVEEKRKQFLQKAQEEDRGGRKSSQRDRGRGSDRRDRRQNDRGDRDRRRERSRSRERSRDERSKRSSRRSRSRSHSPKRRRRERSTSRDRSSSRDRENDHAETASGTVEYSTSNASGTNVNNTLPTNDTKPNIKKENLSAQELGALTIEQLLRKKHAGTSSKATTAKEYPSYTGGKGDMYAAKSSEREKQIEEIRNSYLGQKRNDKRGIIKPSEKFARIFKFEWDDNEDTTDARNPLNSENTNNSLLFGRGYLAGVDVREQRNKTGQKFLEALAERREQEAEKLKQVESEEAEVNQLEVVKKRQEKAMEQKERIEMGGGSEGLHWSEKPLKDMTDRDWRIFREDFDIRVRGGKVPSPLRFWKEGDFSSRILDAINEMGYKDPSPIQRQAIPIGIEQRDIIGVAETGSGKTAAFVIPLLHYIMQNPESARQAVADQGPLALVMAPTRELALQIESETKKLSRHTDLKCCAIVGGASITPQVHALQAGVHVVVGTPGRLIDCLEHGYLVLNQCRYVVLDEADRMVDMGFEPQVVQVLDQMGGTQEKEDEETQEDIEDANQTDGKKVSLSKRTTIMYSATMPPEVEKLANKYLHKPVTVKIGDDDSGKNKRITQRVRHVSEEEKPKLLQKELARCPKPVIVFVNAKNNCSTVASHCESAGFRPVVLHGGKKQEQREEALADFKNGKSQVLVATDVAGRGLDIPDVAQIINYDLPQEIDRYTHRIGRTGRAGKEGQALSFFTDSDEKILPALRQQLISTGNEVPNDLAKHPAVQSVG